MSQPTGQFANCSAPLMEPTFQVRTTKHTGAVVMWINQRHTTVGTYAQCAAAVNAAQQHCMLFGWWSIGSLLWNPISLGHNVAARRSLRQQAQQAHDYGRWWAAHYGGPHHTPVWTPPADIPTRAKWWLWIPGSAVAAFLVLMVIIGSANHDHRTHGNDERWSPTPTLSAPTS